MKKVLKRKAWKQTAITAIMDEHEVEHDCNARNSEDQGHKEGVPPLGDIILLDAGAFK